MGNARKCVYCIHADLTRKKKDKVRCTKRHEYVSGSDAKTCTDYRSLR